MAVLKKIEKKNDDEYNNCYLRHERRCLSPPVMVSIANIRIRKSRVAVPVNAGVYQRLEALSLMLVLEGEYSVV